MNLYLRHEAERLKRIAKTTDRVLAMIENVFLAVCFGAMVGIIFVQFVLQAVFHIPVPWAQETALNLMIWLTCFGASAAVRNRRHIALELLGRALPPKIKMRVASVMYVLSAVFCLGAAWMGAQFAIGAYKLGSTSLVSRAPMWIIYSGAAAARPPGPGRRDPERGPGQYVPDLLAPLAV
jgi:TRAP-type C4-dicarboxylate transport system permease small subunit